MSTKKIQLIGGFPKPDWNQSDENHIGYIQNKPFYDAVTEDVYIEHDGDNTGKVVFTFSGFDFARMADTTVANISDILEASVVGVADGTTMEVQVTSDMWTDMTSNIGKQNFVAVYNNIPFIVFLNEDIDDTYTAGLYVISISNMYVTSFTCVIQREPIKKLDQKYLPEWGVLVAIKDVTSYQEIIEAINAGRVVQATDTSNVIYHLLGVVDDWCVFEASSGTLSASLNVNSNNIWTTDSITLASQSELKSAVDAALTQAKESGEFDGEPGPQGEQGPQGEPGLQGEPGMNGADGYTPVYGVDYWTEADKAEIKAYIDEAILNGAW